MLPTDLRTEQFASYRPLAKRLAVEHLAELQRMPLSFAPSLLRELIEYDYKFPAERRSIDRDLTQLHALSAGELAALFQSFARIRLSADLERLDWVNQPAQFTEQLSAHLWKTNQMDAFRSAATEYGRRMRAASSPEPLPVSRLGIAVIGQGVASYDAPLFRKLREHGTYFGQVNPYRGLSHLLEAAAVRAQAHPVPYGHWYVDGGIAEHDRSPGLVCVSYAALEPTRNALLKEIEHQVGKPGMGPEELRHRLMMLTPSDVGLKGDALLDRFQVKLLAEGSGTQIFSTTFAQWTAREVLRRAEALTLLVRYAPRQRFRPMNELLSSEAGTLGVDPVGSLIDAEMGAYYQWIDQQRLPDAQRSSFLVWFEGHTQAVAIAPSLSPGKESTEKIDLREILSAASG